MKALMYTAPMALQMQETASPTPTDGQVIVDIAYCGICGSDMHAWHGQDARRVPPLILGHEAVGIARSGKYAQKPVAINPLMTCKICSACRAGDVHLCSRRALIGMRVPGAFAESVAIDEDNLTLLPQNLNLIDASLAEPLACALHAVKFFTSPPTPPPDQARVTILGGGAIGLLAGCALKHYGYAHIAIAETNAHRRHYLESLNIGKIYNPLTPKEPEHAPDHAGHAPPDHSGQADQADQSRDIILDAVGSGQTRSASTRLVKPGGLIVHIGLQDNAPGLDTRHLTLQEISFRGSYCYRHVDFADALALLADGHITAAKWTEVRDLDAGSQSFFDIHEGNAPPKIILRMGEF